MVDKHDNDSQKPTDDEDLDEASSDVAKAGSDDDEDEGADGDVTVAHGKSVRAGAVERAASRAAEAHDHGLAHVTPVKLLVGVFGALTVLTVLTVVVTSIDLGSQGNFVIAMIVATIKAGLVMAFFMHLVWDKKFNLTVFLSAFLFVVLFLSLAMTDRNEYQAQIDAFEQTNPLVTAASATSPAAPSPAAATPTAH
jgi:cytochrome c oxidase subunit 4